jgi:SAM-dependent methyltransferase
VTKKQDRLKENRARRPYAFCACYKPARAMTKHSNQAQIEHWNSPVSRRWVTEQERLDFVLGQLDDIGIARAALRAGERVIDIGCGCGASTLRCAERVGPQGSVLGVDISHPMLERARERARALPQVAFVEADATSHAFAPDADLIYSRFGIMFFADPETAFSNLRSALRPDGRLCVVFWRAPDANPWYMVPLRAAAHLVDLPPQPPAGEPGPFSLAEPERVTRILRSAGFRDIALESHDVALRITDAGLDDAVKFAATAGPLARVMLSSETAPETAAQIRAVVRAALAEYATGDTVALGAGIWIATARA